MEVAKTILSQLGGNKFVAMTGAKNLVASSDAISFSIGKNASKANRVIVTLLPSDTYKVEFCSVRGINFNVLKSFTGVFCDQLAPLFEATTGMYVRL